MNSILIQQYPNRISLAQAAALTGYHQDYLGQLCRVGKIKAAKIGRNWYTTKSELQALASLEAGLDAIITRTSSPKITVNTLPIAVTVKQDQVRSQTVQSLTARLRLEKLQKEVLQLSDFVQNLATEVDRHKEILDNQEFQPARFDLRSQYAPSLSVGITPSQRRQIMVIEEQEEQPESVPWILSFSNWAAPLLVAAVLFGGGALWLASNPFDTNNQAVTTIYYKQQHPEAAQVAGDTTEISVDSVLTEPDFSKLQKIPASGELQSRISGAPIGEALQ